MNEGYEGARIYQENTKRWHDSKILIKEFKVGEQVQLYNLWQTISKNASQGGIGHLRWFQSLPMELLAYKLVLDNNPKSMAKDWNITLKAQWKTLKKHI